MATTTLCFRSFHRHLTQRASSHVSAFVRNTTITNTTRFTSFPRRMMSSTTYPPHEVVGLPSLSPTMESGSISRWNKSNGESFAPGDVLCEVETDKATVDFEAQDDGVIAKILVEAGATEVKCGDPILITVEDVKDVDAFNDYVVETNGGGDDTATATEAAPVVAEAAPTPPPAETTAATSSSSTTATGGRIIASPLAYTLAKEQQLDLSQISGTGPGGRILAADVREFVPSAVITPVAEPTVATATAPPPTQPPPTLQQQQQQQPIITELYTDYPLSPQAQALAASLTQSKSTVPHYYLSVDLRLDALLQLRSELNSSSHESITLYALLLKAASCAMKSTPSVNASWMESHVRVFQSVDINVLKGSGSTLIAPVLKGVNAMGVAEISRQISESSCPTEEEEETTGTFSVVNVGMYGVSSCAPIIRPMQAAALGLGAATKTVVPGEGEEGYEEATMLTATLSCDHRVVDGAVGAEWLSAFRNHVEQPTTLLL